MPVMAGRPCRRYGRFGSLVGMATMPRGVLHRMKPSVYPNTCSACGGTGGPDEETPCELCRGQGVTTLDADGNEIARPVQRDADGNEIDPNTAAGMLVCGEGDMAFALAFEDWPPDEVRAKLPPHDVCRVCWPEGSA
jgi:hypothetical protein